MPVEVSAFTIDRRIIRKEVGKEINKALKAELKAALASASALGDVSLPSWIAERVYDMTADWYPFVKSPVSTRKLGSEKDLVSQGFIVNNVEGNPDDAADRLQDFFLGLEQDMRATGSPARPKDKEQELAQEDEKGRDRQQLNSESRIRQIMEVVERAIMSLFYDRFATFS